jgi:two-component system, NarL family, nitrate/nitrite response regulator NarL
MRSRPFATVLAGPSVLLREGIARILNVADFRVIASVARVQDVLPTSLSRHQSVLLIIASDDNSDAEVAQIGLFKEQCPSGRVAVLSDHCRPGDMVSAFQAGANAYFVKLVNCNAFMKALELVMLGETILPPELLSFIGNREDVQEYPPVSSGREEGGEAVLSNGTDEMPRLSAREQSILRCIVEGDSNKAIARKISIAEATVKVHVKAILRKIRLHNRTQAAIWAMNNSSFIWSTDVCPFAPSLVAVSPPLSSDPHIGSLQVPALIDHGNGANMVALAGIDSVVPSGAHRKKS